jgi:tetratricopeptide (TPR) repeat protein
MRVWGYAAVLWLGSLAIGVWVAERRVPSAEQYVAESQVALQVGDVTAAERALRHALARNAQHATARVALSEIANRQGDWRTVAAVLQPIPNGDPLAPLARLVEGDAWRQLGFARRARDCWAEAERLDPKGNLPALRLLFLDAIQLRRSEWKRRLWEQHDRGNAGVPEMVQLLVAGHMVWETGEPITILRGYLAADPDDMSSRIALGMYLTHAGHLTEAKRELEAVLGVRPQDPDAWLAYIECLIAAADISAIEAALDRSPPSIQTTQRYRRACGSLALLSGNPRRAIDEYAKAIRLDLYDRELHHKLALAYRQCGGAAPARRHTHVASKLALIERLCLTLRVGVQRVDLVRDLVGHCEDLLLVEEALGWIKIGLEWSAEDAWLLEARTRLTAKPATSSRHQPKLEEIPWSD